MATSPYDDTKLILDTLGHLIYQQPARVLDVGSGFGRWGFLLRCHMGSGTSLSVQPEQSLRIEAIEAYPGNVTPIYDCVYDHTHVGDVTDVLPGLDDYDVIICSHMIEHLEKSVAQRMLQLMREKSRVMTIISVPLGDWPQEELYGNEYERHRAVWKRKDLDAPGAYLREFGHPPLAYGVVMYPQNDHACWLLKMKRQPWRYLAVRCLQAMRGSQ